MLAGDYNKGGLSSPVVGVLITDFHRAALRGLGAAKVAGNYAADVLGDILLHFMYSGDRHFSGKPPWNDLFWPVENLRDYVRPFCEKHNINPSEAIPDGAKLTPGEANTIVLMALAHKQRMKKAHGTS